MIGYRKTFLESCEPVLLGPFLGTDPLTGQRHGTEGKDRCYLKVPSTENVKRGRGAERQPGRSGGKTFEGWYPKSVHGMKQGREGFGRNQGVKRLRKSVDAAQPGEENPV